MRQIVFSLLLISIFSHSTSAQELDSLYNLIRQKEITDSSRSLSLAELAYQLHSIDPDSSLYYAIQANTISEKINFAKGKGRATRVIGIYHLIQGNYSKSINFFKTALLLSQKSRDKNNEAACNGNLGIAYSKQGNYEKAIEYHLMSSRIRHETGDVRGIATCYNNIGFIYSEQGDNENGLKYFFNALELFLKINAKPQAATAYGNIGEIYRENKKFLDAETFHLKALGILEELKDIRGLISCYANLTELYIVLNEREKTLKYLVKGVKAAEQINARDAIAHSKEMYAKYYNSMHNSQLAFQYALESIAISKEIGNLNTWRDATLQKYIAANKLGKFAEALEDYKFYILLRDSLKNEQLYRKTLAFEHAVKEEKIRREQERRELHRTADNERKKRIATTVGGLIFIFVSICLYSLYRVWVNRTRKELTRIREKISRDIHDEMGSNLSTINILSNVAMGVLSSPDKDEKAIEILNKISDMSHHVMESVDEIVWSLNHQQGSFEEIVGRMRLLGGQLLENQNINFTFCVDGDPASCNLTIDRRNDFYLIYKESITNIAKYAQCKNVHANLTIRRETITLVITDDGVGFNTNILSSGNGLQNMKARSRNLKGQIKIWSEINKGSRMELAFSA